jgi:hypothetical protein
VTRLLRALGGAGLLLALGCPGPPPGWTVSGGTPAQQAQALELLDAARVVAPGSLAGDGGIGIVTSGEIPMYCLQLAAGCAYSTPSGRAVVVCLDVPDLTLSALPHELAHLALNSRDQVAADQVGALIVAEYRSSHP